MAIKKRNNEADLDAANSRHERAREIDDLWRQGDLLRGEAAQIVDAGGPLCSICGERIPRDKVAAHVASHLA